VEIVILIDMKDHVQATGGTGLDAREVHARCDYTHHNKMMIK